ncbi:lytic transglycosylase domain-containing protein [Rhodopseudomonas sp. P2A-2r]|uniref:lytic transglycosylase domain-containing protein n=1 Tax=Rhodopseudomonas sp. P2A-2r TaxID=2991972 RepID=UPI0022349726|nr:lytic transglycosylase domain-containing protein [Rhodopseudomonas sp. P2A-2r]UZE48229.1 lytic transglycosylase domain-containing protein [Rhodopseudomonas sp. P2A-2r]
MRYSSAITFLRPMPVSRVAALTAVVAVALVAVHAPAHATSRDDIAAIADATKLAMSGKTAAATQRRDQIRDPLGRRVAEWVILRANDNDADFARYAAFMRDNPAWPSMGLLQRRAEARLWTERAESGTVLAFFAQRAPRSALGRLAMARAQWTRGQHAAATDYARQAWRNDDLSARLEADILASFGARLDAADHRARMQNRLYANDLATAMRAARRLGAAEVAIVTARTAMVHKSPRAGALLAAVPAGARSDPAYLFTRIQWLRRNDHTAQAAQLMATAPRTSAALGNADAWWLERRALARQLLDAGDARGAYRTARDAAPDKQTYQVDRAFMAGWIALRYLHDQKTAERNFAEILSITSQPTSVARAHYWLGRVAGARHNTPAARQHYQAAAVHGTAYYGQLACARLGCRNTRLRQPPSPGSIQSASAAHRDLIGAAELLYLTGNRKLVVPFVADLDGVKDSRALVHIAEVAARRNDAAAMLAIDRAALNRGMAFDSYAFPAAGLPAFAPLGAKADKSLVYAITRTESAFNPRITSGARATGFMQVTPAAGETLARRMGFAFDVKRLHEDSAYNLRLGSAEIVNLLSDYNGNHVLALIGYNAGRGRVKEWIARYGDPRRPDVDVVDWVERIPFAETRNYVQRVLENLQVYRARFGQPALGIATDMNAG